MSQFDEHIFQELNHQLENKMPLFVITCRQMIYATFKGGYMILDSDMFNSV